MPYSDDPRIMIGLAIFLLSIVGGMMFASWRDTRRGPDA